MLNDSPTSGSDTEDAASPQPPRRLLLAPLPAASSREISVAGISALTGGQSLVASEGSTRRSLFTSGAEDEKGSFRYDRSRGTEAAAAAVVSSRTVTSRTVKTTTTQMQSGEWQQQRQEVRSHEEEEVLMHRARTEEARQEAVLRTPEQQSRFTDLNWR